jgi:hypothetical protein
MIRYFLSIRCSTEGCINSENAASFWYDNPTTSHPCGICGIMMTDCEVLDQAEFAPPPPPPAPIVEEVIETQEES